MHHRAKDITGLRFHFLTARRYVGSNGKKSLWEIECDCGRMIIMPASEFKKGKQKSCGCMRRQLISNSRKTHNMSRHPAFAVWRSMVDRCRLPSHRAWHNYGGRGIRVCPEWESSFEAFWRDMGPTYKPGLTIERVDVNGNYEPGNCIWATRKRQANNKRANIRIPTPWGEMTAAEAADRAGINRTTVYYRIKHGWPAHLLLCKPDVKNRFMIS